MYVAAFVYGMPDAVEKNKVEDLVVDLLAILGEGFNLENPGQDAAVFFSPDIVQADLGKELVVTIEQMAYSRNDSLISKPDLHRIPVSVGNHLRRFAAATNGLKHCQKVIVKIKWEQPEEWSSYIAAAWQK